MSGKQPETILTDQDAAMAKALTMTWPNTCHRLCIWHIYQNAAMHLSSVFAHFPSFSKDFSSCIYDFEEEAEFLCAWEEMLDKYELKTNEWLERMFKLKEKWALVYGRQSFCADMTTTQRSESMNSVLKRYVSYKHNLLQFFHHFDRLIDERRYQELKADLRTCHSTPVASFPVEILKHAASVYTLEVFELFQDELRKAYDSQIELCGEIGGAFEYKIIPFRKHYQHTVMYDTSQGNVSCSCKKFEFAGVLCSHTLKVLSSRNIVKIPELYIKKRWTKKAKKSVAEAQPLEDSVSSSQCVNENEEKKMIGVHYKELCSLYSQLVTRASLTDETFKFAKTGILKMIEEVEIRLENMTVVSPNVGSKSIMKKALVYSIR
ncbi:UNVERIFIED_CONTAM: protein FAR-RED IMPAIRED RESPONSE 1 [Sesamum calycinum]|uniref:Protein FAR1-RELATED SEQUENCE n=1 Tax=Sesamum calycinum TaxID=2727403 RepID=A0AAW2PNK0_9LAMI